MPVRRRTRYTPVAFVQIKSGTTVIEIIEEYCGDDIEAENPKTREEMLAAVEKAVKSQTSKSGKASLEHAFNTIKKSEEMLQLMEKRFIKEVEGLTKEEEDALKEYVKIPREGFSNRTIVAGIFREELGYKEKEARSRAEEIIKKGLTEKFGGGGF